MNAFLVVETPKKNQASWRREWEETRKGPGKLSAEAAQREAERLVVDREVAIIEAAAVDALAAQGYSTAPTVKDAAAAWIAYRSSRGKGLRPTTRAEYESVINAHVLPVMGDRPIADVSRADVLAWRDGLREKKARRSEPLSPRTINKSLTILSGIFATAMRPVDLGGFALRENPCTWVDRLPEEDPQEREPLSPEEVVAVARVMRSGEHRTPKRFATGERVKGRATVTREPTPEEASEMKRQDEQDAALVLTLAFCGMRVGEAAALRWKHVKEAEGRIKVERSYSAGTDGPTKGRENRWTLLPVQVAQPIAKLINRGFATGDDDLVFVGAGGSYIDVSAFRRRFKKAVTLAGITRPVRVHDLRHGATTDLRSVFDADAVRKLVGHKDARTAQRYAHARDQSDATTKWSDYLAAKIGTDGDDEQ